VKTLKCRPVHRCVPESRGFRVLLNEQNNRSPTWNEAWRKQCRTCRRDAPRERLNT